MCKGVIVREVKVLSNSAYWYTAMSLVNTTDLMLYADNVGLSTEMKNVVMFLLKFKTHFLSSFVFLVIKNM